MRKYLKKISFVLALVMCVTFMSVFVSAKVSVILDTSSDSAGQYGTITGLTQENLETYVASMSTTVSWNSDGAMVYLRAKLHFVSTGDVYTHTYYSDPDDNATTYTYNFKIYNAYEADPELIETMHRICGNSAEFIYRVDTGLETVIPNT